MIATSNFFIALGAVGLLAAGATFNEMNPSARPQTQISEGDNAGYRVKLAEGDNAGDRIKQAEGDNAGDRVKVVEGDNAGDRITLA